VYANYSERERHQSRKRYEAYLDEQDSQKLPNAFDLGWKRNLLHLLGPSPWLWFLPICNTTGDGWAWEPSPKWLEARKQIRAEREEQRTREVQAGWGGDETPALMRSPNTDGAGRYYSPSPVPSHGGSGGPPAGRRTPSKADRVLGRDPNMYADEAPESVSMRRLSPRGRTLEDELLDDDDFDDDLEQDLQAGSHSARESRPLSLVPTGGWSGGASGILRKGSPTTPKLVVEHVGRDGDDALD
jgi:palmitoyltransferase